MKFLLILACLIGVVYGVSSYKGVAGQSGSIQTETSSPFAYNGPDDPKAFRAEIQKLSANKVLFVLIGADWCGNCNLERAWLNNMTNSGQHNLAVLDLNYETFPNIAKTFKRMEHIPENHIYYRSKELASSMGRNPTEEQFQAFVQQAAQKNGVKITR